MSATAQDRHEFTAVHMGVPVRVVLYARDSAHARESARSAFARIAELDNKMSDYRPQSEVRQLSSRPREWVSVSPDVLAVLQRAVEVARHTGGAFDPTVGPLVALWRESRRTGRPPDRSAVLRARERTGWMLLSLDSARGLARLGVDGMALDLGGIAKGYILQQALSVLKARGTASALLEAGGDIVVGDAPPGQLGWSIEVPGAGEDFAARARMLRNAAIATSGPSEQFVEIDGVRYSHVIDPRTGTGVTAAHVVTVLASDGATADALATAASVTGSAGLTRLSMLYPSAFFDIRPR